ncbi:PAS domain S-box protein [Candidatus Saccharibacteria bacterium]|nr:PAS domain S-box protein [Candidatus Saccharibacteria bacterium]
MFRRATKPKLPSAKLEHERLTSLINSMADGVIAVDEHTKIQLYNGAALNILDVNGNMQNHLLHTVLKPVNKDGQPVDITTIIQNVKTPTTNRDLLLQYGDGSKINLYISIAPVRLGYGDTGQRGYVIMLRDITHEKSLEEERDEFISVVSHELRTPIAIAEGNLSNAQFMAEKTGADPIKKALEEAHNQVLFLADMINDLSTLSRAERGALVLEAEDIDVTSLVHDLQNSYKQQATDKGLTLDARAADGLKLRSSLLYVREVLQNFVTNSLKYTEHGGVSISAVQSGNGIKFVVKDTGIGISRQDQKRIFDKFFRSEDFRTRSTNGTGLGLYVTAKLAKLLQADIKVSSQLNRGSEFEVTVPNIDSEPH